MENIIPTTENVRATPPSLDPNLIAQVKRGANWFYWIAGLSLVNSAIFAFGGQVSFILGLGITQIIDGVVDASIAQGAPQAVLAIAIVIDIVIVAIFALFGYYANKAITAVFITGMVIYLLDGLLWLALGSYLAAAFHIYVLYMLYRGFAASREVNQFKAEIAVGAFGGGTP
ncbi:hypothetical protein BH10ACI2_BH10ACI2_08080 [soil metagenome]